MKCTKSLFLAILAATGLTAITACNPDPAPKATTAPAEVAPEPPVAEVAPVVEETPPVAPPVAEPPPPAETEHELVDFTPNADATTQPWMIRSLTKRNSKVLGWQIAAQNTNCLPDTWHEAFVKFYTAGDDPKVKDDETLSEFGKWKKSYQRAGCRYREGINYAMQTAIQSNVRRLREEFDKCRLEGGTKCVDANPNADDGIELIYVNYDAPMSEVDWYNYSRKNATISDVASTTRGRSSSNEYPVTRSSKAPATGNGVVQ
jgi:hypothetical protein